MPWQETCLWVETPAGPIKVRGEHPMDQRTLTAMAALVAAAKQLREADDQDEEKRP